MNRGFLNPGYMNRKKKGAHQSGPAKLATDLPGFDALTRGGLPRRRTTLVIGGPGSGKTVFALQTLVSGARRREEPGIFVAFEENDREIIANAATFGWDLAGMPKQKLFFLNAHLSPAVIQSGTFDLTGMLAILKAKQRQMRATWIVFDGLDVLLTLLANPAAEIREIYRIRDWLAENRLTGILTAKIGPNKVSQTEYGFMQFMADCVIKLEQRVEEGISVHRLQILKYRGSDFATGEFPLSIGPNGMEVAIPESRELGREATQERISAGFPRLDVMLGGGIFRGSSTLITGAPGTAKTTLAAKFAESACRRGERTLYVSFDEGQATMVRNLTSVGIHLEKFLKAGILRIYSERTESGTTEAHMLRLREIIKEHRPRCMVVDPLSAVAKTGGLSALRSVANRLMFLMKDNDISIMITALVPGEDRAEEPEGMQVSTMADTWIHLSYLVGGGERNRALTIIKSRGTWHSNQVRELILTDAGPLLTDIYSEQGEVLMGTLRSQKEALEKAKQTQRRAHFDHKRRDLKLAEEETRLRITALQRDLERQRIELVDLTGEERIGSQAFKRNAGKGDMTPHNTAHPSRVEHGAASPSAKKRLRGARKRAARMGKGARPSGKEAVLAGSGRAGKIATRGGRVK
jgi:circadian clock protein KaiC